MKSVWEMLVSCDSLVWPVNPKDRGFALFLVVYQGQLQLHTQDARVGTKYRLTG